MIVISFVCNLHFVKISDNLKPIAEEERRVEAEEKKIREENERIAKALAEGTTALYSPHSYQQSAHLDANRIHLSAFVVKLMCTANMLNVFYLFSFGRSQRRYHSEVNALELNLFVGIKIKFEDCFIFNLFEFCLSF